MPSFRKHVPATHSLEPGRELSPAKAVLMEQNFLTTKELASLLGLSQSYFDKGRSYGYGPRYLRLQASGKNGKILYRPEAVEEWLASQEIDPGAKDNV